MAAAGVAAAIGLSGLSLAAAPAAHAALPGAPGLLAGSKVMPDGSVSTATENPDGSRLVLEATQGGGSAWSPDGKLVAFSNGSPALEVERPNATGAYVVADGGFDPAFTPDGSTILMAVMGSTSQLYSSPSDWNVRQHGGQEDTTPWFAAPTGGSDRWPTVSPTTGAVDFQHTAGGTTDIWTDHGSHTAGLLIPNASEPDISPDGTRLAFVRSVGGYQQIFLQAADGSGTATQLTSGSSNHTAPRWTPDGLGLDYNENAGTDYRTIVGHHVVLAGMADTVLPNGVINAVQQPTRPLAPGAASTFHSTGPTRLLDTRDGTGMVAKGAVPASGTIPLLVEGAAGLPTSGISAAVLNVTVTQTGSAGFLSAYPEGTRRPTASNLNWTAGETIANQVVVPVGADGEIDLYTHTSGTTQVVVDISGYYTDDATGAGFTSAGPSRILDTRDGTGAATGAVPGKGTVSLQVDGRGGVPASGVSAVVLNVTAADTKAAGFLTAYPDGAALPTASNLNWTAGQVIPNHVIVPVGADGKVDLYNGSTGSTDLVADVFGYFGSGGGAFHSTDPSRLLDTRQTGGPIAGGATRTLSLSGTAVPAGATAAVLNVTVTEPTRAGFMTVYPDGTTRPTASNLNWTAGETIPNLVTVPVVDGKIDFHDSSSGSVDVVVDLFGYYGG